MSEPATISYELVPSSVEGGASLQDAVFGEYVIDALVARGGFALVFRAHSTIDGTVVALKVLHPELVGTGNSLARFFREAEVLSRLEHPHIVKIFGAGESGVRPYIVMEWLTGQTLADELAKRGRFSADEVLGVLQELCSALATAHAAGIVHRDLKPSNICVLPDGDWFRTKLVDFGIARLVGDGHGPEAGRLGLTATGTVIGTPMYMAPEQFLGQKVDERSDIYALGVISFELLVGHTPFAAEGHTEVTEQHLFVPAPRVSTFVPVAAGVDAVIARCLSKRAAERPATAMEYLQEFRASLRGIVQDAPESLRTEFVGILVDIAFAGPDEALDAAVLEEIDAVLVQAEHLLTESEMDVIAAAGSAILATRPLPYGERGKSAREATIALALDLCTDLEREIQCEEVTYSVAVHVATDRDELLDPRWTVSQPRRILWATTKALVGIETAFVVDDSDAVPNLHRIRRM